MDLLSSGLRAGTISRGECEPLSADRDRLGWKLSSSSRDLARERLRVNVRSDTLHIIVTDRLTGESQPYVGRNYQIFDPRIELLSLSDNTRNHQRQLEEIIYYHT